MAEPIQDESSPAGASWRKRTVLSAIAVFVLYGNLATLVNYLPWSSDWARSRLPIAWPHADAFYLFGVFNNYIEYNTDFVFLAEVRQHDGSLGSRTVPIDVSPYLPPHRGDRNTFVWASRHRFSIGPLAQLRAWGDLVEKLRQAYNRDHPEAPIGRVSIIQETWPVSKKGYSARRTDGETKRRTTYVEW